MTARTPVLAVLAVLALASCAQEPEVLYPSNGGTEPAFVGRTFVATTAVADGEPRPLVDGTTVELSFTADAVGVQAGCNSMGGDARYDDERLRIGTVGGTEMACDELRMDQDAWLAGFLADDPAYALDGDELTLTTSAAELTLVLEPSGEAQLLGTRWELTGIADGSGPDATVVGSAPRGVTATLRFRTDGVTLVRTGCNGGSGRADLARDTFRLRGLVLTDMACTGVAGAVENAVLAVLGAKRIRYELDDGLTLRGGGRGLTYRAA